MCPVGTGFLSPLSGELVTNKQEYFGMHVVGVNFTNVIQAPPGYITLVEIFKNAKMKETAPPFPEVLISLGRTGTWPTTLQGGI